MKPIDIVADESVDYQIVKTLRAEGFHVYSIAEKNPSFTDAEVLRIAVRNSALLITEDKDFGELVHRLGKKHSGILLIRLIEFPSTDKARLVLIAVQRHLNELMNTFSVLDKRQIRKRKKH